jgi:endonuclease/exonuclease/phosphatase (EEP) superfamily protein YafD
MIFAVLMIAACFLTVFTLLPLWRCEAWWVRSLDFPRMQLTVIALLLLVLECWLLDWHRPQTWGLSLVTLLCFAYQAWWIVPYTKLFPVEVKSTTHADNRRLIRILTANVLTPNRNAKGLMDLVRENTPDIVVTLESDSWWQSKLDALQPDFPHTVKCPQDNLYGMHVYSRLPLQESQIKYLVEADVPSIHALVTLPAGTSVRVHFLHPAPPSPTENAASSERDAELIVVAKSVADAGIPAIVAGDLNDVAWSETTRLFRKISGLLDPRVGRGMFNTFHADYWFIRWPLDHLFHSDHFTLKRISRLRHFGSDHFAIFTELMLETHTDADQVGLDVDSEDKALADAKTNQKGISKHRVPQPEKSADHH